MQVTADVLQCVTHIGQQTTGSFIGVQSKIQITLIGGDCGLPSRKAVSIAARLLAAQLNSFRAVDARSGVLTPNSLG